LQVSRRAGAESLVALADLSNGEVVYDGLKQDPTDATRDNALLSMYHPKSNEPAKALRALNFSGFNPPPANRRLMGDFYYIDFTPIEADLAPVVIVANTRGFFVSQSKQGKFNPSPAATKPCHSSTLSGCLSLYSAKFKKTFEELLTHTFESRAQEQGTVPFPPNNWLGRTPKAHEYDFARAEYDLMHITETNVIAAMQGRDWNEELQTARSMPRSTPQERIARDRALYRIHAEYVDAAKEGALAIFNGQVVPLNRDDSARTWIYLHNNIFYTQAYDMRDTFADCGGDETFSKALSNDLVALRRFNDADPEDLHTLDNVLIRYCGRSIYAQTLIPGLFHGLLNGVSSIVYGTLEDGTVARDDTIHERVGKIASALHLKEHKVVSKKKDEADAASSEVSLYTSAEIKGIIGTDNRHYILDFSHLLPRDGNYASDKHPTAVFRPELISAFLTRTWLVSRNKAFRDRAIALGKLKKEADEKGEKLDEEKLRAEFAEEINVPFPSVALNSDLYVKGVTLADSEETVTEDKKLNLVLSRFLTDECIPGIINDWASAGISMPIDTLTLTNTLHQRGVNMRYLGLIATLALPVVPAMKDVLFREMIVRAAKTAFARLVQNVPSYSLGEYVVSFLNAFFDKISTAGKGSRSGVKPAHLTEAQAKEASNSRDDEFGLSHHSLWASIRSLVESKFGYTLPEFIPAGVFEIATLRALCLQLGIRLEAKNYDFNKDAPFDISNLIEMLPIIKHAAPTSKDAEKLAHLGKQLMQEGKEEAASDCFNEALSLYHQSFGPMNRETGHIFASLALVSYQLNDADGAISNQERAVLINERVLGPDHFDTIYAYGNLAQMVATLGDTAVALNYLRRALYLGVVVAGWNHPENVNTFINIIQVLQDKNQFKETIPLISKAQKIVESTIAQTNVSAEMDLAVKAVSYATLSALAHLGAISHAGLNNFREALALEKRNYELLKQMKVPDEDPRLLEANQWLTELTRKAVEAEKTTKAHAPEVGARLGAKKGVNTKLLKKAGGIPASSPVTSAVPVVKRTGKGPSPNAVIGKGVSASASSSASAAAAAAPSASPATTAAASAAGKKKGNGKKTSAPVPDLL
jgi:protein TIF31